MSNTYLQIGSWNVEHLSKEGGRTESPYALVDHIEMSGIDILALQEIYVTGTRDGSRRNRELGRVCELLKEHRDQDWDYELFPNRDPSDTSQLCGILWNKGAVSKARTEKIDVSHQAEELSLWDRPPHAVKFTANVRVWERQGDDSYAPSEHRKSIVVVPLHMKSNYGGASRAKRIRALEAESLAAQLDRVRSELDQSVILIGDTNVLAAHEPAITHYESAGLEDLNASDAPTYPGYGGSPFDRAFVDIDRREFAFTRQYILQSANTALHDKFLSDHYLIKISVKIYVDDRDPVVV